jgi:deltex-like protein
MTQTNTKSHNVRRIRWDPAQALPVPLANIAQMAVQGHTNPAVGDDRAGAADIPPNKLDGGTAKAFSPRTTDRAPDVECVCSGCSVVPAIDVPVEDCCICMCQLGEPDRNTGGESHGCGSAGGEKAAPVIRLLGCCSAFVHRDCMQGYLDSQTSASVTCPLCQHIYGVRTGSQPPGRMVVKRLSQSVEGHEADGTIQICYMFEGGVQGAEHAHPGVPYEGTRRKAFLPDNSQGNLLLAALTTAFERRLIFTIGQSVTSGKENQVTWNGIHHKTKPSGGTARYGWPDETYFDRVTEELRSKGVDVGGPLQTDLDKDTSAE